MSYALPLRYIQTSNKYKEIVKINILLVLKIQVWMVGLVMERHAAFRGGYRFGVWRISAYFYRRPRHMLLFCGRPASLNLMASSGFWAISKSVSVLWLFHFGVQRLRIFQAPGVIIIDDKKFKTSLFTTHLFSRVILTHVSSWLKNFMFSRHNVKKHALLR